MNTEIAEYTETERALAELRNKYAGVVFDVTKFKHMAEAKEARAELRTTRTALEKMRVDIKAPALDRCRKIDSEAKRITSELLALESPIDEQIKAEEQRKAREKEAKEQAERDMLAANQARFDAVNALPLRAVGATTVEIETLIAEAKAMDGSFSTEVITSAFRFARDTVVAALSDAAKRQFDAEQSAEAEAARVAAEREELERLRADADRLATQERERAAAEARRVEEKARAEREAVERAAREAREEEQRRIDAERAEARRREDEERAAAAKKLREEQDAAAQERARLAAEKKAQEKRERDNAIVNATLHAAAADAVELLRSEGFGDHLVTLKLAAALNRESQRKVA